MERQEPTFSKDIVESAAQAGGAINRAAYRVASDSVQEQGDNRTLAVRKAKAQLLDTITTDLNRAKSAEEMFALLSKDITKYSLDDLPSGCGLFMEESMSGRIPLDSARGILISYMWLRTNPSAAENGRRGGRPRSGPEPRTSSLQLAVSATVKGWVERQDNPSLTVEMLVRAAMGMDD